MNHHYLESAEFYQRRYHNFASRVIIPTILLILGLITFSLMARTEITISSRATIEPIRILANIQSTSNQPIVENQLKEGQVVDKNQVLIKYQATEGQVRYDNLKSQQEKLSDQKSKLEVLRQSIDSGQSQFTEVDPYGYYQLFQDYLSQRQSITGNIEQQNSNIAAQNAASSNQQAALGGQINQMANKISELHNLRAAIQADLTPDASASQNAAYQTYLAQLASLPPDAEPNSKLSLQQQFIAQLDGQIEQLQTAQDSANVQYAGSGTQQAYTTTLDSQLASLRHQTLNKIAQELTSLEQALQESDSNTKLQANLNDKNTIIAQEQGLVHLNSEVADAKLIPEGSLIAQLYPVLTKTRQIKLTSYLSSRDIARIKKGDSLRFVTQNDQEKSITLTSKITSIATTATKTEQGNFFKVEGETKLTAQQAEELRYGLEGKVILITGKKSYFDYYKDQFLNQ